MIGVWNIYFGSIFPYIREFNFIVCGIGFNGVGVYKCVS